MSDIDTSQLDVRLDFLNSVLYSSYPKTPITGHEMKIAQSKSLIIEIQDKIPNGLSFDNILSMATKIHGLSNLKDALYLLLDCYEMKELDFAFEIIHTMIADQKSMTTAEMYEAVREGIDGVPPMLFIAMNGGEKKEEKVYRMPSGLNLEAMRDFK